MARKNYTRDAYGWSLTSRSLFGVALLGMLLSVALMFLLSSLGSTIGLAAWSPGAQAVSEGAAWYSGIWLAASSIVATFLAAWVSGILAPVNHSRGAAAFGAIVWAGGLLLTMLFMSPLVSGVLVGAANVVGGQGGDVSVNTNQAVGTGAVVSGWFFLTSILSALAGVLGGVLGHRGTDMPLADHAEQFSETSSRDTLVSPTTDRYDTRTRGTIRTDDRRPEL